MADSFGRVRVEPAAEMRGLAAMHRQMYLAWTEQGFSPDQAMALLMQLIEMSHDSPDDGWDEVM